MKKRTAPALEQYREKRDFSLTSEPGDSRSKPAFPNLRFVVQKHAARRLHYDFRLELDGVLQSWAVPNGPSLNPNDKRLAVHVEAHPLEYATFEGVIGHGNYGSGQVIVWDFGVYSPDDGGRLSFGDPDGAQARLREGLVKGKLSFTLRGQKMKGSWTLVRTARGPNEWLLIKHKDGYVDERDLLQEDASVQSGLTLEDLKNGRLPPSPTALVTGDLGKVAGFPASMKPMLASFIDRAFDAPGWMFEPKLDGYRILAFKEAGRTRLYSRSGKDMTADLPRISGALERQPMSDWVLDGEVVAMGEDGRPDFGLLQRYFSQSGRLSAPRSEIRLEYHVFDILYLNGRDLTLVPLMQRKQLLELALVPNEALVPVQYLMRQGEAFFRAAMELGLEGMMAKRQDSTYHTGLRTKDWLKIKAIQAQEFVVGGYTQGEGARSSSFGALLLGYHRDGEIRFCGRVGTGFTDGLLRQMSDQLRDLTVEVCPFADNAALAETKNKWVKPTLVAKVKFSEWTEAGHLRAPVFVSMRGDQDTTIHTLEQAGGLPSRGTDELKGDPDGKMVREVLEQLQGEQDRFVAQVGSQHISFTNLNKAIWPASKGGKAITKRDMIRYYARMAPFILPHLKDRPITLTRYPNGIEGKRFYQKHYDQGLPDFVDTVKIFSSHSEGDQAYILVNDLPTLLWLAQLANIELHPWNSRIIAGPDAPSLRSKFDGSREQIEASALNHPDFMVFDLDPYIYSGREKAGDEPEFNKKAFAKAVEVARALKEILDQLSLSSFVKTSGKTGLHIYVPIVRKYEYATVREVCQLISKFLLQQTPNDTTIEWSTSKRTGKIFLDYNQNARGKNMASIYSLRPQVGATVSTPVLWSELDNIWPSDFNIRTVPGRSERVGDLWRDILDTKHDLAKVLGL